MWGLQSTCGAGDGQDCRSYGAAGRKAERSAWVLPGWARVGCAVCKECVEREMGKDCPSYGVEGWEAEGSDLALLREVRVAIVRSAEHVWGGRWARLPILRCGVSGEGWAIGTEVGGKGVSVEGHFGGLGSRDVQGCPSYAVEGWEAEGSDWTLP